MGDLMVVQIVATLGAFVVLIGAGTLPFCLVRCSDDWGRPKRAYRKRGGGDPAPSWLLSLCNCFATGVFISTCFLGLVPHVRQHGQWLRRAVDEAQGLPSGGEESLQTNASLAENFVHTPASLWWQRLIRLPDAELLLVLGFLFILLLEQVVVTCHSCEAPSSPCRRRRSRREDMEFRPLVARSNGGTNPFGDSSSDEDEMSIKRGGLETVPLSEEEETLETLEEAGPGEGRVQHAPEPQPLSLRSAMLLLGLGIHAVFEGVALGVQTTEAAFMKLLVAIMLHEVLCVVAFGLSLAQQRTPLSSGFMSVVLLGMTIPLGMVLGLAIPKEQNFQTVLARYLLEGLAAGIFVYVACVEMLGAEMSQGHSHGGHGHSHGGKEGGGGGGGGLSKAFAVCLGFGTFLAFSAISGG